MIFGVLVVGILFNVENKMIDLENCLVEGEYFIESEEVVLVVSGVVDKLGLVFGDILVLISQGYCGVNVVGKYLIKGIVKFGFFDFNK